MIRFITDERGATAIEYGLIASLIAGAIIVALGGLRDEIANVWNGIADDIGAIS